MTAGHGPHIETPYLADGVAGDPARALLFLLAAQAPNKVWSPIDLGEALVQAEQRPEGDTIYKAQQAKRGCLALRAAGYLAPGLSADGQEPHFVLYGDRMVRANPHLLSHRIMVATAWLDLELSLPNGTTPDRRIVDIVGQYRSTKRGQPGVPSLSLALYEAMLASEDGTINLQLLTKHLKEGHILCDPRMRSRIRKLRESGVVQEVRRGYTRIRPDLVPFMGSLLGHMRLLAENATNPTYHDAAEARAQAILSSATDIRRLLAKTQHTPQNKRPHPPKPPKPKRRLPPPKPPKTPAGHLPMQIRPGTYPANWLLQGLCTVQDVDPQILKINPNDSRKTTTTRINKAKSLCPACPVSSPCARSAIAANDQTAIAGHTPAQRAALTSRQRQEYLDTVKISTK